MNENQATYPCRQKNTKDMKEGIGPELLEVT